MSKDAAMNSSPSVLQQQQQQNRIQPKAELSTGRFEPKAEW
jgi:hypothetical protein